MLRRAGLLAALAALLVPAVAGTANADAAKRKKRTPVVKSISPMNVFVGETLTVRGRHFRPGVNKNTVAFKRRGAKAVFVKAEKGTKKLLRVTVPKRIEKVLPVVNGTPVPARLKIRVLAKRFGKRFTKLRRSPLVGPEKPPAPPTPPAADPDADCDGDGQVNRVDTDDDNDLLTDDVEKALNLDACKADTDGDAVSDGYEHQSARDLNDDEHQEPNNYLPYPEKRPYPNALDKTDAGTDHDGDSLTLKEEFDLWKLSGTYSAGEQYTISTRADGTGRRTPALDADGYDKHNQFLAWTQAAGYDQVALADVGADLFDEPADWWAPRTYVDIRDMDRSGRNANPAAVGAPSPVERLYYDAEDDDGDGRLDDGNGKLDDGERDEDADGLTNFAETRGCMNRALWDQLYDKESPYPIAYGTTSHVDGDSDGDGVLDGADDQDNDDVPNVMECSRTLAADLAMDAPDDTTPQPGLPAAGFVNPFNPCLPHMRSRTCRRYVTVGAAWAPFNPDDVYYLIKN